MNALIVKTLDGDSISNPADVANVLVIKGAWFSVRFGGREELFVRVEHMELMSGARIGRLLRSCVRNFFDDETLP